MLEEITTQTKTYKFGTTDLNFSLCLDKEYYPDGNEKGTCFIAQSLRDEDCFSKSKNVYEVSHIFRKKNNEKLYHELVYYDRKEAVIPESVKILLNDSLLRGQ